MTAGSVRVIIEPATTGITGGKLAEAAIVFLDGPLVGLKLIGFGIWESFKGPATRTVTLPARQYSINGERRSFAMLRPVDGAGPEPADRVRRLIIEAFAEHEDEQRRTKG